MTEELVCTNCLQRVDIITKPCPRCQGTAFIDAKYAPLFEDYQADSDYQSNAAGTEPQPKGDEPELDWGDIDE